MKKIILVSPNFPPSTVAGVHRTRLLARHLPAFGWEPVVVCARAEDYEEPGDLELAAMVDPGIRVVRVKAWPKKWCRNFGLGDIGIRAYSAMKSAAERLIVEENARALFVTVLPGFPMFLAPQVKRRFRVPVVIDVQDPWVSPWGKTRRFPSKAWAANRLAEWIEPNAIRHADAITSVSEGTNEWLRSLYPDLPRERFSVLPIGGDAADFDYLKAHPRPCSWLDPGFFNVVHVGTILPRAGGTLRAFLRACAAMKDSAPAAFARLRLVFVGTSNRPGEAGTFAVKDSAAELGLGGSVVEIPGRVPYAEAINTLVRADLVLMLGSDEPHYTASKLFPGLLSGCPVLALFHERSSVCGIAAETGGATLIRYGAPDFAAAKTGEIAAALERIVAAGARPVPADPAKLARYSARSVAEGFAAVFDRVAGGEAKP